MNQDERNTVVERDVVVRQDRLPGWAVGTMVVLGLLAIGGLGLGWWATTYAQNSRQSASADLQTMRQGYTHDMDAVQQRMTATEKQTTDIQDDLTLVTKHLQITQGQLKKARQEAQQIRDDSKTQIAALNDSVTTQLATKASAEDVTAVTGQVGVVRTDLDATKTDLNGTTTTRSAGARHINRYYDWVYSDTARLKPKPTKQEWAPLRARPDTFVGHR